MLRTLHRTAAVLFYILAGSFFVAALLLQNNVEVPLAAWWMQVADLPLLASALIYGGLALHLGMRRPGKSSPLFPALLISILTGIFLFFVVLNFWGM